MVTCEHCGHPVWPGQPHKICDEIIESWKEQDEARHNEEVAAYEAEICPCGHKHDQHHMQDDFCQATGCDCPQFGEPVENYETHTITNVGGDPGGLTICE